MTAEDTFKHLRTTIIPLKDRNCYNCANRGPDHGFYTGRDTEDWAGTPCEDCDEFQHQPSRPRWKHVS